MNTDQATNATPEAVCSTAMLGAGGAPAAQAFGIIDPDYARIYTQARIIAWSYGYACLAHGSFTRDLDLLLVPWTETAQADDVDYFAPRIADAAGLKVSGHPPSVRPHGRKTWTLLFPGFADPRWVDLSVLAPNDGAERERCARLCDELDNDENTAEYRAAARWAAARIRSA